MSNIPSIFIVKLKEIFSLKTHNHVKSEITNFAHTHTKSQISDFPVIPSGIPSGMICWFYLTSAPSGWKVCDGTNGTPNLIGRYPLGANTEIGDAVEAGLPEVYGQFSGVGQYNSDDYSIVSYGSGATRYAFDGHDTSITGNYLGVKVGNEPTAEQDDVFSFRASNGELKPEYYSASDATLARKMNDAYVGSENSVFGKSNTVTPPSVKLLPCMKI